MKIEVEVKVHLPYDANGTSAQPGQVITVDTDSPMIRGYIEAGYLYPLEPLELPVSLRPPASSGADRAADAAADQADGEAPAAVSGDASSSGGDGAETESGAETPAKAPSRRRAR